MTRLGQTAIVILSVVSLVSGCADMLLAEKAQHGSAKNNSTSKSVEALRVKAVQVKKTNQKYHLEYPGVVLAKDKSELSFRVSGNIEKLQVKVGDILKKGQLIAQLDRTHYQNARQQALAAKKKAQARMKNARAQYQSLRKLKSHRDISRRKLQEAQTTAKSARAEFRIAQKRLARANRQLDYTSLHAPFDGIVATKRVHAHQNVQAGQPLVLVKELSNLLFKVHLPPSLFKTKDSFKEFQCRFPAQNGLVLEAKLHSTGKSAQPPLRTFPLTVELNSSAKQYVMPGTNGILRITACRDASQCHLLVPSSAITSDNQGNPRVWIAKPKSNQAEKRSVKLGGLQDGKMAVESGISSGEWVITAGQANLSPGQRIKIVKPGTHSQ